MLYLVMMYRCAHGIHLAQEKTQPLGKPVVRYVLNNVLHQTKEGKGLRKLL
jgi:hypothetical protein